MFALAASLPAHADLWGYIDDRGVAHLAPEKIDARYQLFFRGDRSFDTRELTPAEPAGSDDEDGAAPDPLPRRLQAFFDTSPAYLGVRPLLRETAQQHRIDYELLKALIVTESGFDPRAISPKGAVGLMQVMPATAERWGLKGDARRPVPELLTEARTNLRIGARYLRHLIDLFPGRLDLALAAYNAGEGAVQRAGNRIPDYRETQAYVRNVLQIYHGLKPPAPRMQARAPQRVRVEMPAPPPMLRGGAIGRGNMPAGLHAALPNPSDTTPD
ncbi:lytic transglycosylase domain-containing protein [Ramlibacter sp. AW1]|uniref:Lytic transglycosylase domain-containing protein n=1 Tax=Ramlibacter aurantiacus TaxID=2801330 RepID=A0A937D0I8_9BURK|nr:lytic transglycosylase domain-containing protein [Ramlibacter aurantiacus]